MTEMVKYWRIWLLKLLFSCKGDYLMDEPLSMAETTQQLELAKGTVKKLRKIDEKIDENILKGSFLLFCWILFRKIVTLNDLDAYEHIYLQNTKYSDHCFFLFSESTGEAESDIDKEVHYPIFITGWPTKKI